MECREIEIVQHPQSKQWIARVVGERGRLARAVGRTPDLAARALRGRVERAIVVLDALLGSSAVRVSILNQFEEGLRRALRAAHAVALQGAPLWLYWVETDEDADSGWVVARTIVEAETEFEDAAGIAAGLARAHLERAVPIEASVGLATRAVLEACGVASRAPDPTELDALADLAPELRRLLVRGRPDPRRPS